MRSVALVGLLALCAVPLAAQRRQHPPLKAHSAALADSIVLDTSTVYHLELGVDVATHNDSVTQSKDARVGYLIGRAFSVELAGEMKRAGEAFDVVTTLGITAALLPGDNSLQGKYVEPLLAYHYLGGPAQMGLGLEIGTRVLTAKSMAARASVFTIDFLRTRQLPTLTAVGAKVGLSFWK